MTEKEFFEKLSNFLGYCIPSDEDTGITKDTEYYALLGEILAYVGEKTGMISKNTNS